MIGKIKGYIDGVFDDSILLDVNGVCYNVLVCRKTLFYLTSNTNKVELFIEMLVRETGTSLFGFLTFTEQVWFRHLLKLNGISGKIAISIMSSLDVESLSMAIATKDEKMIATVPGIGKKLANRIVNELDGVEQKIANEVMIYQPIKIIQSKETGEFTPTAAEVFIANSDKKEIPYSLIQDAITAMCSLGFSRQGAYTVVQKIAKDSPNIELQDLVKEGIKQMGKKD